MKPNNFLICDLESTHKIICSAEILTIAFIVTDMELNIIEKRSFKLRPKFWTNEHNEAVDIHKITRQEAMTFPDKEEVLNEIINWLSGKTYFFAGHFNRDMFGIKSSYDYALLQQEYFDIGNHYKFTNMCPRQSICSTHTLAEWAFKEGKIDVPMVIKEGNKKASRDFSLKNICRIMGVDLIGHHGAEVDAMAAYNLLLKFSKMIDIHHVIENDWRKLHE